MITKFTNCIILSDGTRRPDQEVVVENGRIVRVGRAGEYRAADRTIDLRGLYLAAGFVDIQVNGAGGALFQETPDVRTLERIADTLRGLGVTSFLPTLTLAPPEKLRKALAAVEEFSALRPTAALGVNLEGPFINPKKAGMANANFARSYYDGFVDEIRAMGSGVVYMTVSPEIIDESSMAQLEAAGVVVALGHTESGVEEANAYFDRGASVSTHIFNAMTGVSGRAPGVAGAVMTRDDVATSLIADGYHIHPCTAKLVYSTVGPGRIALVSDGMPSIGCPQKSFVYEGQTVTDVNGRCTTADGVLAGTGVALPAALANMAEWVGGDLAELVQMVTSTPSRILGIGRDFGSIQPGFVANMVVMDRSFRIENTIIEGVLSEPRKP